jgi:macrolide-specific efflux system membrane fusion protein
VIAPSELDLTERSCAVAEQQVSVARAELSYAETQCDYARIVAPIDGVVASVATQEGETVAASFAAPTFVTLLDLAHLEVWAYVDETDIGRIHAGQTAVFTVDTYPGEEFPGRVTTIYPKAEIRDNVVNYVAVVEFIAPPGRILRPEMTATVRIALVHREQVPTLPTESVQWAEGRPFVLVHDAGHLVRRPVTLGARDERFLEIVDGVRLGEEVALGSQVSPVENIP